MKKVILFAAAIIATSLASCKKDYTCECTTTESSNGTTITHTEQVATYKATHKSAEKSCESYNTGQRTCDLK